MRGEPEAARELAERSYAIAIETGSEVLAGEALNVLAGFSTSRVVPWRRRGSGIYKALELGGASAAAPRPHRAEPRHPRQHPGRLAGRSPDPLPAVTGAFESSARTSGCAIAYHNLGMVSSDRELWEDADSISAAASSWRTPSATSTCRASACSTTPRSTWPVSATRWLGERGVRARHLRPARGPARQGRRLQGDRRGVPRDRAPRPGGGAASIAAVEQAVATGSVLSEAEASTRAGPAVPGHGPKPGGAWPAQRGPPPVRPARCQGRPGGRGDQGGRLEQTYSWGGPGLGAVDRIV